MIKVMIVDDSALIRKLLTDILGADPEITIVGTARNGKDALEKIGDYKPDVITLDVEMPIMDGLTTLKHIVKDYEVPVIMISTLTEEGASLTLKALEEGAVDFLQKPTNVFGLNEESIGEEIVEKVKIAADIKVDKKPVKTFVRRELPVQRERAKPLKNSDLLKNRIDFKTIVAIGTSTGGPRALQEVIPEIPGDIDATVVIVQHMPAKFTKSLADRINLTSELDVKEAEEGEVLKRGCAYIAPGDYHMEIVEEGKELKVKLNQKPKVMGLRPTVDIMMNSVAKIGNYKKVGVILTGMGSDGAEGIENMKKSGAITMAQDEKSSVVFGMPRAAIATECIDQVLDLNNVSKSIVKSVGV